MSMDLRANDVLQPGRGEGLGRSEAKSRAMGVGGWIVSPWFDILFFCNFFWVLAFLPIYASPDGEPYIQFWMAYFLATPHRWLTLVLVASDRDRRAGQTWLFGVIAVVVAAAIAGIWWATGDFRSLFLFYTLLLGGHFALQHRLVLKMYSGHSQVGVEWMETWLPLIFVVYANVRLVAFLEPIFRLPALDLLRNLDYAMLAIPVVMLAIELLQFSRQRLPKLLYMLSVFGLWTSVLWTAHWHQDVLCAVLLGAVTVFHAVEYLALVSYYAWKRREVGSAGLFQTMARNWTVVFAWYVIGCGLLYSLGDAYFVTICYAINTWASILHCVFDAMMWRYGDPATAEILGIDSQAVPEPSVAR